MAHDYISSFKTWLRNDHGKAITALIWGDPVRVLSSSGNRRKVRARTRTGWVKASEIGDKGLLELYIIDVGQGDGVLMRTPDDAWHLMDAGVANRSQMTGKGAANFIRWKFIRDLERDRVQLKNLIVTHPDYDHYGGCLDLLAGRLADGRTFDVEVGNLRHCGIGRFDDAPALGALQSGKVGPFPQGYHRIQRRGRFITELLDGKDDFDNPARAFSRTFAEFARLVAEIPDEVSRLTAETPFLPDYGPGGDLQIRVLGPVLETADNGVAGLRWLGSESVTRNGHSIALRLDYGKARILLTGDLNTKSQRLMASYLSTSEFACDVAKGCHHGSEDVDMDFIRAMRARATVISSGDNEDYAHPRPAILGASARYGREAVAGNGDTLPPLIYSTELARSVKLAMAAKARVDVLGSKRVVTPPKVEIDPRGGESYRRLDYLPVSTDLVYGLVNVRTDGEHILIATLEEKGGDFDVKVIKAGVDPAGV